MSSTTRRTFLSGAAAAAAAAYSAGCKNIPPGNTTPPSTAPPGPPPPAAKAGASPMDQQVAFDYMGDPVFLDPTLKNKPSLAMLLYGLVCIDVPGQEVLLPNTNGLSAQSVPFHDARLWVRKSTVPSGATADGELTVGVISLAYWSINGFAVTIMPTDGAGTVLTSPAGSLAPRNSTTHPWTDMARVRSLKKVTGLDLILPASRDDLSRVSARVNLTGGTVTAVPPFTKAGRNVEWKVTPASGPDVIGATADSMLWHRGAPTGTLGFKVSLRKISDGSMREVVLDAKKGELVAVVTHATTSSMSSTGVLHDTRAFAQLLQGGNMTTHPVAQAHSNFDALASSSSDGHCESGGD